MLDTHKQEKLEVIVCVGCVHQMSVLSNEKIRQIIGQVYVLQSPVCQFLWDVVCVLCVLCIILMSSYVNSMNRRVLSVGQTSARASQMWTDIKYDVFFS